MTRRLLLGILVGFVLLLSVVDANLRTHDVPNLYLMWSGWFPAAGKGKCRPGHGARRAEADRVR
jgi:hypothetical protein